ncbi:MAG: hypothetical protein GY801_25935 [bacterium]|nr:hypothetical protein [bacterium]
MYECHGCGQQYHSSELERLVSDGSIFGFNVMTYIGQALFLRHRTLSEVLAELDRENVTISSSTVSDLARRFILCLAIAHKESGLRIKDFMTQKGGYILHLDGLCEGGSPHVISVLDEIGGFVLGHVKIPTENAAQIVPLLEDITRRFGKPQAIVHDMGRAILKAVAEVFGDVRNFMCHFHFLEGSWQRLVWR